MENISNKMGELIKINVNDEGKQLVSARELYLGLGLNKSNWSRWYPKNILGNEFFSEGIDYIGVRHKDEGNNTIQDFAITLELAKHLAMMARTPKSHEYRNYFIECEKELKEQTKNLSPLDQLALQRDAILQVNEKVDKLESSMPLFSVDCKELQALVKKVGISALGGKDSAAYKDKSIRTKVYSDIQKQIRRQFGVSRYEAIRHTQLSKAVEIVKSYELPYHLKELIGQTNNQLSFS